ncbi:MAG: aspartate aminotransferase family protein, partial [Pseudomonadota bacterium]
GAVTGPYLRSKWATLADHPLVGEARICGLMGALELVADKETGARFPDEGATGARARDLAVANGLVMRAVRDTMVISPPLIITEAECDTLVEKARTALDTLAEELSAQGKR